MRVLALEPYYGGSHRAFLDGWIARSRHDWTLLTLPAHKWKWRMRHSAVTFADEIASRTAAEQSWDVTFCSDMLPLAEFLGLAPFSVRQRPGVAYFHENQLTYPARQDDPRDLHFAFSNMLTALAATSVWFNSEFHRTSFLTALEDLLDRMPDHTPIGAVDQIRSRSDVVYVGIDEFPPRGRRRPGPMRIVWAARWEYDKNPEEFFEALDLLSAHGVDFRVSVVGQQFHDVPDVFAQARGILSNRIDRWGYQQSRGDYEAALIDADVIVSTADHEFFGLSVAEAIAAGAYPLLPERLAYPEILSLEERPENREFFYDGGAEGLADRLGELAGRLQAGNLWGPDPTRAARQVERFSWKHLAPALDEKLEQVVGA